MTTIAFKAGVLAADTKAVGEHDEIYKCKKLETLPNKTVVGCAGDADVRDILSLLGKATLHKMPLKSKLKETQTMFKGIWVFPTGEVFKVSVEYLENKWDAEILPILESQVAVGSGGQYAMGAMAAGKTAIEAVRIACRLDNNSGLPIESFKFE